MYLIQKCDQQTYNVSTYGKVFVGGRICEFVLPAHKNTDLNETTQNRKSPNSSLNQNNGIDSKVKE